MFAATLLGVLLPRLNAEVEVKNRQLGLSVGSQVASFLGRSSAGVRRLGAEIAATPDMPAARVRLLLDTPAHAVPQFEAFFLVGGNDQVTGVGLPMQRLGGREQLVGVVFFGSGLRAHCAGRGPGCWRAGVLPIVIDRRGNVVAHPDPLRGLRKENIGQLASVKSGLAGEYKTSRFVVDGIDYVGTTTPIGGPGRLALIAQPADEAFATVCQLYISQSGRGLCAGVSRFVYGRRLTVRVAEFSRHVQAVADGNYTAPLPHSRSEELDNLAMSMRKVANAVLKCEEAL